MLWRADIGQEWAQRKSSPKSRAGHTAATAALQLMLVRAWSWLVKRRSISVPPRSAMLTAVSCHPCGTWKLYLGISLHPTPCPPLFPSGLVYVRYPSASGGLRPARTTHTLSINPGYRCAAAAANVVPHGLS